MSPWNKTPRYDRITYQCTHGVKITSLLRQNDVAVSFWRNNDVIITSCIGWIGYNAHRQAAPQIQRVFLKYNVTLRFDNIGHYSDPTMSDICSQSYYSLPGRLSVRFGQIYTHFWFNFTGILGILYILNLSQSITWLCVTDNRNW